MQLRRFSLAEGANLPGGAWFRACLGGIRARLVVGRSIVLISCFGFRKAYRFSRTDRLRRSRNPGKSRIHATELREI